MKNTQLKKTPFDDITFPFILKILLKISFLGYFIWLKIFKRPLITEGKGGEMNFAEKIFWLYKNIFPPTIKNKFDKTNGFIHLFDDLNNDECDITLLGDLMLNKLLPYSKNLLFKDVEDLVFDSDITIANLEFVIGNNSEFNSGYGYEFKETPPLHFTSEYHNSLLFHNGKKIDLVNLANNYINDIGYEGAINTFNWLNQNNIKSVGFSPSNSLDEKIQIVKLKNGVILGIVSFTFWVNKRNKFFNHDCYNEIPSLNEFNITNICVDKIRTQVNQCRENGATFIVLSLHWGLEFEFNIREFQKNNIEKILYDCDIDLVWGHHPHVIQPYVIYKKNEKNIPVFFSLGNTTHPYSSTHATLSAIVQIKISEKSILKQIKITPIVQKEIKRDEKSYLKLEKLDINNIKSRKVKKYIKYVFD